MTEVEGSIEYEEYYGEEDPFIPIDEVVAFELVPEVPIDNAYLYPAPISYKAYAVPKVEKRSVIIDIETTGVDLFDSKLVCIGCKDVRFVDELPTVFFNTDLENEELPLIRFLEWFANNEFNEIIGYNVNFDYRWLIALCLKYRIVSPALFKAECFDIMTFLKKGKRKYLDTMNKVSSLQSWTALLLGDTKLFTIDEYMLALKEKRYAEIEEYCKQDVELEFYLWLLIVYCSDDQYE